MLGKSSEASETASTAQLEERYAHLHELDHQLSAEWAALSRVEKLAYAESRPWEDQLAAADAATAPDAKVFIVLSTARGAHFLDAFLRRLQSMHPAAAIVGGIVSSGAGCVLASRQVVRRVDSGVACLAFRGNVPLTALICREEKSHMQEKLTQVPPLSPLPTLLAWHHSGRHPSFVHPFGLAHVRAPFPAPSLGENAYGSKRSRTPWHCHVHLHGA
mmetsp:Transcript_3637/g.11217  ORF Transcript_3637/g.11217 Transcript_3637/m.11217 type:complete len:217 (-) Transcript_3637:761-1411(-)